MDPAHRHGFPNGPVPPAPRMCPDTRLGLEFRVGPAQLLLSELLPLPATALQARLEAELSRNAALELPDPSTCDSCGHPVWRGHCIRCVIFDGNDRYDSIGAIPAPTSPRERLLRDSAPALGPADRRIAAYLLADIDDFGVLDEPIQVVAQRLRVDSDAVRRVIAAIRLAGFPGLCAVSLVEGLRLQVAEIARHGPVPPEVHTLIGAEPDVLLSGDAAAIERASGQRSDQAKLAMAWLRAHLVAEVNGRSEPLPAQPVDMIVRRSGDCLLSVVVPGPWSAARVAESYRSHAAEPSVRRDVARASRFVEALGRRDRALRMVGDAVIGRQWARLIEGPWAQRRMTRREIAAEIGVHESTVSRVVTDKHVSLPTGETLPLAALFESPRDAQDCLRELVDAEVAPLSDGELAAALAERGHPVARRTVAKYRNALGIPDRITRRRGRQWGAAG